MNVFYLLSKNSKGTWFEVFTKGNVCKGVSKGTELYKESRMKRRRDMATTRG